MLIGPIILLVVVPALQTLFLRREPEPDPTPTPQLPSGRLAAAE